ncbi:zinc phosphodiesterase ELAC protein 1 [Hemicordylus capensis]|uniref:zinc phosphodiesterase ELAC protein 1 n=1 Tax=Hemicordylus capensis TaxID=884348 RepID=UPI002304AF43|nr:zinc phosphodiesterase ELAC protein 1 [Hemicordylus capensis]XP_053145176.1 zinc phosphodiesterase ELAC protein 1 [Hemicordylus capensis]XP_053145177.1 zinc phosphodiesterase ELAC protein 1 [Hemicordylus capensis]XP_053145178.1 zinc phosphodiesterase ELAC protein 1 [Hemicordylus capensis]XP_053145180.1 zinc phosphodiesterase ELAC protein 1 [Hemicordylus capensis]XP_053145181.1 zinc phosphodiesterase ELAC protein 1 [Hemicordylus capensis]XP_053145182.1 zinc phosphodiesterase ELAC protein 1 
MSMDVTFLGTGAAYPSPTRGASATVVRFEGECWLFDCGEGTQTQFMKSHLKAGRITKIFITHLHGDHFFGLPGLLCTISLQSSPATNKPPVEIYGPLGLRSFLWRTMELSHSQLLFPYVVHELVPTLDQCPDEERKEQSFVDRDEVSPEKLQGNTICLDPVEDSYTLVDNEQFVMKAFRLFHRIPSFGFLVEEKPRAGRLNVQKLKELGVQPGPLYGQLKDGSTIVLENGTTISPSDVLENPLPGRKICILGDCSGVVGGGAAMLCHEADLLVHEATLDDTQADKAKEHGHSTPKMAAEFAKLCKAKKLVLSHFSQRYKPATQIGEGDVDVMELKRQAELVLDGQEVVLAEDFMTIDIPIKKQR